jgi:hypothetical protein
MLASTSPTGAGATSSSGPEPNSSKSSTIPSQTTASRLEQLPLELRQQIYTYVFADNDASIDVTVRLRNDTRLRSSAFPAYRSLLLTNCQIATEVRSYFFAFHRFRFVGSDEGYLALFRALWRDISFTDMSLIRRIALPLYSIGLFGNVDCSVGQTRLRFTSMRLAHFPGLTHLDLGVCLAECLPASHGLLALDQAEAEELEQWDWSGPQSKFPMRRCFEVVGLSIGNKGVEINIYWSVPSSSSPYTCLISGSY